MKICNDIQKDLDAYRDDVLDAARRTEIAVHLASCQTCRGQHREAEAVESIIRAESESWQPPEHLWERIEVNVDAATAQSGGQPSVWLKFASVAVLVMMISIGIYQYDWSSETATERTSTALANEFHTFVISQRNLDFSHSEPLSIREWFGDKVGFRVPLPVEVDNTRLLGGRLCNMLDRRVVSFMYKKNNAWISLYIMQAVAGDEVDTTLAERFEQGYGYIGWYQDGLEYSLIGDVSIDELRDMLSALRSMQLTFDDQYLQLVLNVEPIETTG
ncbi:MAG: zf-HC2 domain-containing protein [Pseudomonadota bacterium]